MSSTGPGPAAGALPFALAVLLVLALQFGPALGLAGFQFDGSDRWTLMGLTRDALAVALIALGGLALMQQRPWPASVRWALATVLVNLLFALAARTAPFLLALNLRRLVFLPLLFVALWLLPWTPHQIRLLVRLVLVTSIAVALLGLVERALPESFWALTMDIDRYNAANALDRWASIAFEDSGRFFSWDLERWLHGPLRRMVSTYLEPTTLAAAMAAALALALAERERSGRGFGLVLLFTLAGLLTVSKGFALFLPALLAWRLFGVPSPRHALGFTLAIVGAAWGVARLGIVSGAVLHVDGLLSALQYLGEGHWFGEGLGGGGNYSESDSDIGAESGLGNAIAQVGVAALLPLLWIGAVARDVLATAAARRDPGGPWLAGWLLFWLISYLLSASSLGVGGNALGFALLALYLHPSFSSPPCASPS